IDLQADQEGAHEHQTEQQDEQGGKLSPYIARDDPAMVQAMVDAIYDRGYYRLIRLESPQGRVLYERNEPLRVEQVPSWFVHLFPLEAPTALTELSSGWNQAGTLRVSSHPGFAHAQLWRSSITLLAWFLIGVTLSLSLGLVLLRRLLNPLRAMEQQADAICRGEFPIQETLPGSRELRHAVMAMNRMSARVERLFLEQSANTEQFQRQAYIDPLTELGNRRHFQDGLSHLLSSPDEFQGACLLLIQIRDLKAYNDRHGLNAGDELLRRTAGLLRDICAPQLPHVYRLGGGDFTVLVHGLGLHDVEQLARDILARLGNLLVNDPDGPIDCAHIGIIPCIPGEATGETLARADQALRIAQQQGPGRYHTLSHGQDTAAPRGAMQWRDRLAQHLDRETFIAHFQAVQSARSDRALLHHELLLRAIEADGTLTPVGIILPMAERVGLASELDQRVTRLALQHLSKSSLPLAVNLSPSALGNPAFVDWLISQLKLSGAGQRLTFELPEYALLRQVEAAFNLAQRLRGVGSDLAIDHFGRGFASFAYLKSLKPRYLKIDGSFTHGIHQDTDHEFFVRALTLTAHEIDIQIIAESVETEEERNLLEALNVDGLQGYLIGRPQASIGS
ncbi:MAG: EAL domain-containing protein, partial [Methylococcus sp.]